MIFFLGIFSLFSHSIHKVQLVVVIISLLQEFRSLKQDTPYYIRSKVLYSYLLPYQQPGKDLVCLKKSKSCLMVDSLLFSCLEEVDSTVEHGTIQHTI
jgi:hypothetical protein